MRTIAQQLAFGEAESCEFNRKDKCGSSQKFAFTGSANPKKYIYIGGKIL